MSEELNKETAIVTGSYGDIGDSIARKLLSNNISVALMGRDIEKLKKQKSELSNEFSAEVIISEVDMRDSQNIEQSISQIANSFGRVDFLINNAGMTRDNIIFRISENDWNDVIDTNLKGTFLCCKHVSKHMIKQKSGVIVNISSVVAKTGNKGQVNYVASKAGIDGITKTLSKELGARGVRVNSVAPGFIQTNMTKNLSEDVKNNLLKKIPLNRFGTVDEVASLVFYLISENSSYLTGQVINLDGGMVNE